MVQPLLVQYLNVVSGPLVSSHCEMSHVFSQTQEHRLSLTVQMLGWFIILIKTTYIIEYANYDKLQTQVWYSTP